MRHVVRDATSASRAATGSNPDGGTGASSAAPRIGRVAIIRSQIAAPIEWPIRIGGGVELARDVLDVGDVVVEAGDEQRLGAAARRRGRAATAHARASPCAANHGRKYGSQHQASP